MQTALSQTSRVLLHNEWTRSLTGRMMICFAATLAVAAAAHVSIPLWFTPVPFTLQPLAVLGVGLALGPIAGFFTMLAYLAEGAIGLPVFSPTGLGGVAQILGPTGGFLMAYPLVAAIAGVGVRLRSAAIPKFAVAGLSCLLASTVLFAAGAGWLMFLAHLSFSATWAKAVSPFLIGAVINIFLAAGTYSTVSRSARS